MIYITQHEIKEGNMLQSGYTQYLVNTRPFNYTVKRRYSDFEWLKSTLSRLYPGQLVAPLPTKSLFQNKKSTDERTIKKRKLYLE